MHLIALNSVESNLNAQSGSRRHELFLDRPLEATNKAATSGAVRCIINIALQDIYGAIVPDRDA